MGLQLEHLPREEVAADGGKERKGRECFEPGRFFSNWAQVSFEETNKLLVSIFSGVPAAFVPGAPHWEDCPGLCCNPAGVAKLGSSTAACEVGRGAAGGGDKPWAQLAAPRGRAGIGEGQPPHLYFSPLRSSLCFAQRLLSCSGASWLLLLGLLQKGPPPQLAARVIRAQARVTALLPRRRPGLLSVCFGLERLHGFLSRFSFLNACFNCSKTLIDNYLQQFESLKGFNSCVSGQFISAGVFSP